MAAFRVLLTNDDGIDAPGMAAMEKALSADSDVEIWVAAPDRGRSACSHGMSLTRPIFVQERGDRRFAIGGLPADCIYLSLFGLMPQAPDVVVSGINHGANLGSDVIYSGTVAGAREAAVRGIHGIAVSLVDGENYENPARSAAKIISHIATGQWAKTQLLNLNYPCEKFEDPTVGFLGARKYPHQVSRRKIPLDGNSYYWLGGPPVVDEQVPGSDGWLIGQGIASATFLSLDQTESDTSECATELFSSVESIKE